MDARRRGIQILGWISVIAGYGLALLLIRGAFLGITRGFAGHPHVFWILLAYLLFIAVAVYLFAAGRRALLIAKGNSPPVPRFGWERILLGALLIFAAANNRFHFLPTRHFVSQLQYQNQTQAVAGNGITIAVCIGSLFLILSGIWKGFRRPTNQP
jgi:hypothetical protein